MYQVYVYAAHVINYISKYLSNKHSTFDFDLILCDIWKTKKKYLEKYKKTRQVKIFFFIYQENQWEIFSFKSNGKTILFDLKLTDSKINNRLLSNPKKVVMALLVCYNLFLTTNHNYLNLNYIQYHFKN